MVMHRRYVLRIDGLVWAYLNWDAKAQKWEVTVYKTYNPPLVFLTDEGTYRKPPKKMVETLVAVIRGGL